MGGGLCRPGRLNRVAVRLQILLVLLFHAFIAWAAETACPEQFAGGIAPDLINPELSLKTREICCSGYAVRYSGVTRTPLYSAELLTKERLLHAKQVKRQNRFHPDENIPADERAELRHYANSGYDRGHMAPAADMPDEQSQYESFSLANMVPQAPGNNRGVWAKLEALVRRLTEEQGQLYVITGPIFDVEPRRVGGAVSVPVKLFKAVLIPATDTVRVFLVDNRDSAELQEVDLQMFEAVNGVRLFPGVNSVPDAKTPP